MLAAPVQPPPDRPGCYIFRDGHRRPIYVGKAKSLKHRVPNYFQANVPQKVRKILASACDLEYVVTANEWEAFLLENNLIKQFRPRFNAMLKDDKTYPFVKLTIKERYPKAVFTRRISKDGALYFGPFVPGWQAKKMIKVLQEHFRVATCKDPLDGTRPRPCLYYEMGKCYAPCIKDRVNPAFYGKVVEEARLFLEGKTSPLRDELNDRMRAAASRREYELAAHYRDLGAAAESLGGSQAIVRPGEGRWDLFALYGGGESYLLHGFLVVEGRVVDRRRHRFDEVELSRGELLASALARLYGGPSVPDGVAVSEPFEGMDHLARYLSEKRGRKVPVVCPRRGPKASLIRTLSENARIEWEQSADPSAAIKPLAEALSLPAQPWRIECFDISHTQGEETVASCVVWEGGVLQKREYRSYKVKDVAGVDDFASMAEVVARRYARLRDEGEALPGLILVDGGLGQANAAASALRGILDSPPPVAGLAKREEHLFLPGRSEPVVLPHESPALLLLQKIRDEAHRRAVAHHRRRLSQVRRASPLLAIPGVGPATAKRLLRAFLTTEAALSAGREALESAVGKTAAARIRAWADRCRIEESPSHSN